MVNTKPAAKHLDIKDMSFEKALKEGRVRADSPADVNTLVRLRSFLQGGADSRAEVNHGLSLEVLSGYSTRAEALAELSAKASATAVRRPGEG